MKSKNVKSGHKQRKKHKESEKELQGYKIIEIEDEVLSNDEEPLIPGSLNVNDDDDDDGWFTPTRMLALLTSMFFMVYLDRGI